MSRGTASFIGEVNDLRAFRRSVVNGPTPWVVAVMDGGIVQNDYRFAGHGEPEFDILDFDREGEDDVERAEWLDWVKDVVDRMEARGLAKTYVNDLRRDIERMEVSR